MAEYVTVSYTHLMTAALISRYLNIDISQYESVELPYADLAEIPDWALGHVKALYAQDILKGTVVNGVSMFQPGANATRAQIMTLMGRTISRGYSYGWAPFDDRAQVPTWAQDHVDLLYYMNIVSGYAGTNEVRPTAPITRAEFASLLYKIF